MIIDFILHTPWWVWQIFGYLFFAGMRFLSGAALSVRLLFCAAAGLMLFALPAIIKCCVSALAWKALSYAGGAACGLAQELIKNSWKEKKVS